MAGFASKDAQLGTDAISPLWFCSLVKLEMQGKLIISC